MANFIQVTTTVDSRDKAEEIAQSLVTERLVACAQVMGPITSWYWWHGKIETTGEWMCIVKTREELYPRVERAIHDIHPYEVPEIVATRIQTGSENYLKWLADETAQP